VIDLVLDQGRMVNPCSMLHEASSGLVERSIMNCEPCLRLFIDLIHDLEDGAFFQEIVADLALQVSQDLEEFKAVHLWASHQLLQGIGQSRLQFNEGLYCLLIRLLEIRTVDIRKIFALEFID